LAGARAVIDGQEKLIFCSNNYLALAQHPRIKAAVKGGLGKWGFGSGGSRLVCGNTQPHERLQNRLAHLLGKEHSLIFPSGYTANLAVLQTLPQAKDLIVLDRLVHASLIDGARASRAVVRSWPHRDTEKLARILERGGFKRAFMVTDSLFSMDGDFAGLEELVALKKKFDAWLMVDEAHAFGCLGPGGKGYAEQAGLLDEIDIFVATFSKALGGSGGFVAGSGPIIDYLINKARSFIFTTAIPAINCLAAEAALDIIGDEPERRQRLGDNGEYFRRRCGQMQIDTAGSGSYIVPLVLGEAEKAMALARRLWEDGIMIPAIRPPTVKPGSSRLRVSLMSEHTKEDIDALCEALGNHLEL